MVKIIDGEIYQDNDPRLQEILQRQRAAASQQRHGAAHGHAQARTGAAGPAPAVTGGFNFSAPPFRIVEPLPGQQPMFGLPDMEIFAVRVSPMVIAGLLFLLMSFGWRGALAGAILFYIFQANAPGGQPGQAPQGAGSQGGRPQGAAGSSGAGGGGDIFRQLQSSFQQHFGGSGQQQRQRGPAAGPREGAGGAGGGSGGSAGSGLFSGRGHKLGGS